MKHSFVVQYCLDGYFIEEEKLEIKLSAEESRVLRSEAETLKQVPNLTSHSPEESNEKCFFTSGLTYSGYAGIDMRSRDSLSGICEKIQNKFLEQLEPTLRKIFEDKNDCIDDFLTNEQGKHLLIERLVRSITFPMELLYPPFIFRDKTCLKMADCFQFNDSDQLLFQLKNRAKGTLTPGHINAWIITNQEFWRKNGFKTVGQQQSSDPIDESKVITPDLIFSTFDLPWLIYFFVQQNCETTNASGRYPVRELEEYERMVPYWRQNRKDGPHFGIKVVEASDAGTVKIECPDFCLEMRKKLFDIFFADRTPEKHFNTLKYQHKIFERAQERLSTLYPEGEKWYYEMCTGMSLTLMITALFIKLGIKTTTIKKGEHSCSWNECSGMVLLNVLTEFRPFIITCPAVYCRISMVEKALFSIHRKMKSMPNTSSPLRWTEWACGIFYASFCEQFFKMKWPINYCDGLGRLICFPSTLIQKSVESFIREYQPGDRSTTSKKLNSGWSVSMFCPPEYYPYISEVQAEVDDIRRSSCSNYRSTREPQRIFEEVRNALYPDGFIDFEA